MFSDPFSAELEFVPRTQEPLLVPCLWAYDERDRLYSFAAITDDRDTKVALVDRANGVRRWTLR